MLFRPLPTAPPRTCAPCPGASSLRAPSSRAGGRAGLHRGRAGRAATAVATAGAMLAIALLMSPAAQARQDMPGDGGSTDGGLERARQALGELSATYGDTARGDWRNIHAWQRFVIISTLSDYELLSADRRFHATAARALANRRGLDGNDDDLWVAQADLDMARLTHAPGLLADARRIFDMVAQRYWDTRCRGGVWWDHARTYKNAITNELFLATAVRLYQQTHDDTYRDWAGRSWAWLRDSGMINASGLVNDGLDAHCANNAGPAYSYNQGVILDALAGVAALSHDTRATAMAARIAMAGIAASQSPDGGFHEARDPMNMDARIFRGIFVRALGHLVPVLPDGPERATLSDWLVREGEHVWATRRPPARFSATWGAGDPFIPGAQAQVTAAALFLATVRDSGGTKAPAP